MRLNLNAYVKVLFELLIRDTWADLAPFSKTTQGGETVRSLGDDTYGEEDDSASLALNGWVWHSAEKKITKEKKGRLKRYFLIVET